MTNEKLIEAWNDYPLKKQISLICEAKATEIPVEIMAEALKKYVQRN